MGRTSPEARISSESRDHL